MAMQGPLLMLDFERLLNTVTVLLVLLLCAK